MLEGDFLVLANKTINHIADSIVSQDNTGLIEVNFDGDAILHIIVSDKQFVINIHVAARQIWLASPVSGPHHFNYIAGKWLGRNKEDLLSLISLELNNFVDFNINLNKLSE